MKALFTTSLLVCGLLAGCQSASTEYTVSAHDSEGNRIVGSPMFYSKGYAIETERDRLCARYPEATIIIRHADTGEELHTQSPYPCPEP